MLITFPLVFCLFEACSDHLFSTSVVSFVITEATSAWKEVSFDGTWNANSVAWGKSLKLEFGTEPSLLSAPPTQQPPPVGTQHSPHLCVWTSLVALPFQDCIFPVKVFPLSHSIWSNCLPEINMTDTFMLSIVNLFLESNKLFFQGKGINLHGVISGQKNNTFDNSTILLLTLPSSSPQKIWHWWLLILPGDVLVWCHHLVLIFVNCCFVRLF